MKPEPHHIHCGNYYINTHSHQRLAWVVQRWVLMDLMGGYIWGWPRIGKTQAIERLQNRLTTRTGEPIRSFFIPQHDTHVPGDLKFYQYIQSSLAIDHDGRVTAASLYGTLLRHFMSAGDANSERRVILFFDEAQLMTRMHYVLLLGLVNDLQRLKYRPLIISVGSNELPDKIARYHNRDDAQLRHRFFHAYHRMYGLRDEAEVAHALSWFDSPQPKYASTNGYVADLVPELYEKGWRLASHAKLLWTTFKAMAGDSKDHGWQMAYFCIAVRLLLCDIMKSDGELTLTMVKAAISASGMLGPVADSGDGLTNFAAA